MKLQPGERAYPCEGVEVWVNPKNKFTVFQIHYSADPKKRSKAYRDNIKSAMPIRQFMQEYELRWESFSGLPVFPDWDSRVHGSKEGLSPVAGLPLLRAWDWGLTPACLICQMQEDTLVVLREITEINMGADRFSDKVLAICQAEFPQWWNMEQHWIDFIDPSGEFRKDTDENTCALILIKKGMKPIPGAIAWEERRQSVEHFLTRSIRGKSCFKVDATKCPVLVRGFEGGYRYDEKHIDLEPTKVRPLKDEHSHIQDALQMVTSRIRTLKRSGIVSVPSPYYAFGKVTTHGRDGFGRY
jgi:hypothetical protein